MVTIDWPGKGECLKTLDDVQSPVLDEAFAENVFIEADNLVALKAMQKAYASKIKMIYIDPPYNTRTKKCYKDSLSHGDWLSMMYPRLCLARNLLREDGVIFISIDDHEQHHLRMICDEIFGEGNFVVLLCVEISKTQGMKINAATKNGAIAKNYEFVLIFAKNKNALGGVANILYDKNKLFDTHYNTIIEKHNTKSKKLTEHLCENTSIKNELNRLGLIRKNKLSINAIAQAMRLSFVIKDYIYNNISDILYQQAACNINIPNSLIVENGAITEYGKYKLTRTSSGKLRQYIAFKESLNTIHAYRETYGRVTIRGNLWKGFFSDMMNVAKEGGVEFKSGKKSVRLIKHLMCWFSTASTPHIILDFFAGSATTAHAVMKLNAEDGGNRKFIMVQLPEPCKPESEAYKAGYKTIADIGRERIKRAAKKIQEEYPLLNASLGFREIRL